MELNFNIFDDNIFDFTDPIYLPNEIINQIFIDVGPNELNHVSLVCRQWKSIAQDKMLWQKFQKMGFFSSPEIDSYKSYKKTIASNIAKGLFTVAIVHHENFPQVVEEKKQRENQTMEDLNDLLVRKHQIPLKDLKIVPMDKNQWICLFKLFNDFHLLNLSETNKLTDKYVTQFPDQYPMDFFSAKKECKNLGLMVVKDYFSYETNKKYSLITAQEFELLNNYNYIRKKSKDFSFSYKVETLILAGVKFSNFFYTFFDNTNNYSLGQFATKKNYPLVSQAKILHEEWEYPRLDLYVKDTFENSCHLTFDFSCSKKQILENIRDNSSWCTYQTHPFLNYKIHCLNPFKALSRYIINGVLNSNVNVPKRKINIELSKPNMMLSQINDYLEENPEVKRPKIQKKRKQESIQTIPEKKR